MPRVSIITATYNRSELKNVGSETALLVNISDVAYRHDDPDHWRLPADCPDIPYRFSTVTGG